MHEAAVESVEANTILNTLSPVLVNRVILPPLGVVRSLSHVCPQKADGLIWVDVLMSLYIL